MTTAVSERTATAKSDDGRRVTPGRWPWLLATLAFLPLVIYRAGTLSEADTFWQIRVGLLAIAHHAISATDTFSWTMHGKPYMQNSWGFDVVLAVGYRLAGLPGAALLCGLITMGIAALALALARKLGASAAVSAITLILASPLLIGWLSARPQLIDYGAVLTLVLLVRRLEHSCGRGAVPGLVGLLTLIWVNLHAAALLAVAIAGASAVLLVFAHRTSRLPYVAAATCAAAIGCLANPYGFRVLQQASQVQAESFAIIKEWAPLDWARPMQDLTLAIGLIAMIIAWRRREIVVTAALMVCDVGAVAAVRLLPFAVILAVPVLAAFVSSSPDVIRHYLASRRLMFRRCGALGFVALAAMLGPSLTHIGRPEPTLYPAAVVRSIPAGSRLFTTDLLGGYVILVRPDVAVSLDSRNTLYGAQFLLDQERILQGRGNLARELARAGSVLVPPGDGLARRLLNDPQWQIRASNQTAVLYVRRSARR